MTQSMVLLFPLHWKSLADPFGYDPKSEVLETPMLSVCTTDLYGDLLRHQDVIDRNFQDDAECQHVVNTGILIFDPVPTGSMTG